MLFFCEMNKIGIFFITAHVNIVLLHIKIRNFKKSQTRCGIVKAMLKIWNFLHV